MAKNKEYELALKIVGMVDNSLNSSCNLTKKQLRSIAREAAKSSSSGASFKTAWTNAGKGIDTAWNGAKKAVVTTTEAMLAAGAAVVSVGAASVKVGKEFESAMSSWAATASANEADYQKARDAAMEMGRTTSKTATQSAQALEYMALAGWKVDDSISALPSVLRLSEATGLDLARTSDLVTDSMSALGVEVKGLQGYLDVAAKANNKSNQTAEQLMEAYLDVGGTMKNLGIPIQESAAALGVLANRGIKGSEAGNALNAVMVNLTTGTGQAGKMMKKLGISAFDSQGNFVGLRETLDILNTSLSGLSDEEKNAALAAIGGKLHVDALNGLMSGLNTTVADGTTEWDNLQTELNNASGAMEKMAETKLDNLTGDLNILQSALQDSGIRIYDSLNKPLREATQELTDFTYNFSDNFVDKLEYSIPTIKRNLGDAKEAIMDFADPFLKVGGWMLDNPDVIAGGLAAIGTTITGLKLANTIISTVSALNALKVAMMSNPITAAIGLTALAGGAIIGVSTKIKLANAEMKKQNLAEHFGDISLSLKELNDAAQNIVGEETLKDLSTAMEELDKVSDIASNINDSSDAIKKLTWKISMGMELDDSEKSQFDSAINSMIDNSIDLVEQAQYTAHINVNALFGEEDETGQQLIDGFDAMYNGINEQVKEIGRQLGEAYNDAMEDGVIDTDEAKLIQELQAQLARVTNQVSQAQLDAKLDRIKLQYDGVDMDADTYQNLQKEVNSQISEAIASANQSFEYDLGALNLRLSRSQSGEIDVNDADYLTKGMYDNLKAKLEDSLKEKTVELNLKGLSFGTDAIKSAYSDELDKIAPDLANETSKALINAIGNGVQGDEPVIDWTAERVGSWLNMQGLTKASRENIQDLWKKLEPQFQDLANVKKQYEEAGKKVPQSLANGIKNTAAIGVIAGSRDAMWAYLEDSAETNQAFQSALSSMQEAGGYIPDSLSQGIENNSSSVEAGIDVLYERAQAYLNDTMSTFDVNSKVNLKFDVNTSFSKSANSYVTPIIPHADGGIFDTPHYGVFAEENEEAFIPIDGSQKSVSIWKETGEKLGVIGNNPQSSVGTGVSSSGTQDNNKIVYSPVYHISGASEEVVKKATSDDYSRFESLMSQYNKSHRRLNF